MIVALIVLSVVALGALAGLLRERAEHRKAASKLLRLSETYAKALAQHADNTSATFTARICAIADATQHNVELVEFLVRALAAAHGEAPATALGRLESNAARARAGPPGDQLAEMRRRSTETLRTDDGEPIVPVGMASE